ncbi:MAG: aminotransferase class IV [Kiritimatiellaceae bacterium]|nr:aminotransferase class IV [Kiritimatiellaceae bacterium]
MTVKLQEPEFVYMNGKLTKWADATLHIGTEAVTRSLNVFEGLKGYWNGDGCFGIVFMRRHYERMLRSAKLLHLPCPWSYAAYESAVHELLGALLTKEQDMWARVTLFGVEGHWGVDTVSDMVVTAYNQKKEEPSPIKIGISTWRRSGDNMLPYRVKTGANYEVGRLARIEGSGRGYSDMILLNADGRVSEATASCVVMVRDGVIYTPPHTEGSLESVTLDFVKEISISLGYEFVVRPIDRTELLIADELALVGSLAELVPVEEVDGFKINPSGEILSTVRKKFFAVVRGEDSSLDAEFSFVPNEKIRSLN